MSKTTTIVQLGLHLRLSLLVFFVIITLVECSGARSRRTKFLPFHKEIHVWEDVFPIPDLNLVTAQARRLSNWAMSGDNLLLGKRSTCWLESTATKAVNNDKPSLLLEQYIHRLAQLAATAHSGSDSNWLGYEYWVQRVGPKEQPAFHYDKDEAMSSLERQFIFPDVSSIFYLTYVELLFRLRWPFAGTAHCLQQSNTGLQL